MGKLSEIGRRFWRWFITPPTTTRLKRRAAWALWLTPTIMGFPLLLLPILEPSSIPDILAETWPIYLLFFCLPYAAGALLWRSSRV